MGTRWDSQHPRPRSRSRTLPHRLHVDAKALPQDSVSDMHDPAWRPQESSVRCSVVPDSHLITLRSGSVGSSVAERLPHSRGASNSALDSSAVVSTSGYLVVSELSLLDQPQPASTQQLSPKVSIPLPPISNRRLSKSRDSVSMIHIQIEPVSPTSPATPRHLRADIPSVKYAPHRSKSMNFHEEELTISTSLLSSQKSSPDLGCEHPPEINSISGYLSPADARAAKRKGSTAFLALSKMKESRVRSRNPEALEHFRKTVQRVIRMNRMISAFRVEPQTNIKGKVFSHIPSLMSASILDITYTDERTPVLMSILKKSPDSRTEIELDVLWHYCGQMKALRKFGAMVQREICKKAYFEEISSGRLILKQETGPLCFYILLRGRVQLFKTYGDHHYRLVEATTMLMDGDSIGDPEILQATDEGTQRNESALALTNVEVLRVDRFNFQEILETAAAAEMEQKIQFFALLPLVASMNISANSLAERAIEREFLRDKMIVEAAHQSDYVYFIIKGTCRIITVVEYIEYEANRGKWAARRIPPGFDASNVPLDSSLKERVVSKSLCVGHLEHGAYFGEGWVADRMRRKGRLKLEHYSWTAATSVVADTRVHCYAIDTETFLNHTTLETIKCIESDAKERYPPKDRIIDEFLESREWSLFKKHVVKEVLYRKAGT
ncbi:uncharacterized protein BJ171DRAFT_157718 [Polychytrium aggregatum]|uniref:uncharacterized protein n=1 Tax=Polychytrium aggregatum TaxID=110093 RepID=UPI0022FE9DEB|nr:uncharacterized protein BJ171DRAFT_157718 [Polychytrium aggregatum]KAI9202989.1 hypothetical protein BJ171DRAFT_157718 [Polychytrium aggregatum]